jgi:hypothetical protein
MTTEKVEYDFPSKPGQKWVPSWIECPDCDELFCVQHQEHAHDCDCPSIDEWAEHDVWPYKEQP